MFKWLKSLRCARVWLCLSLCVGRVVGLSVMGCSPYLRVGKMARDWFKWRKLGVGIVRSLNYVKYDVVSEKCQGTEQKKNSIHKHIQARSFIVIICFCSLMVLFFLSLSTSLILA